MYTDTVTEKDVTGISLLNVYSAQGAALKSGIFVQLRTP